MVMVIRLYYVKLYNDFKTETTSKQYPSKFKMDPFRDRSIKTNGGDL